MEAPPTNLVCLTTLPRDQWPGKNIWHPMGQQGGEPYWRELDMPDALRDPEAEDPEVYFYDVGIVVRSEPDPCEDGILIENGIGPGHEPGAEVWFKHPEDKGDWGGLHYPAYNLWILP